MAETRGWGRYGDDVLAGDWKAPPRGRSTEVPAELGMVVEEVTTGWCGEVVRVERDLGTVALEDRRLKVKVFPLGPGFLLEGRPVVLVAHGGLIAALTAALLDLPVDSWPVLGGMGNASWAQLSGHGQVDAPAGELRWRLDVWNASAQVANDVL